VVLRSRDVSHARPRGKLLILLDAVVSTLLDDWRPSIEDYPELDEVVVLFANDTGARLILRSFSPARLFLPTGTDISE
jgi:hypothetical protein